jgi:hypothetical protein
MSAAPTTRELLDAITEFRGDVAQRFDLVEQRFEQQQREFLDAMIDFRDFVAQRFELVDRRFDRQDGRFEAIESHLQRHDRRFDAHDRWLQDIEVELKGIKTKLSGRRRSR